MTWLKPRLKGLARSFGYNVVRIRESDPARDLFAALRALRNDPRLSGLEATFLEYCLKNFNRSASQVFQDLFVQFILREKREGYFVEFGATNGIDLSNTLMLEKHFGWHGILAEPGRQWHEALTKNRRADIDFRCVWTRTGDNLKFTEAFAGEFSTITRYASRDMNRVVRSKGNKIVVESISLADLLKYHNAPYRVDYISIDTEGSELPILEAFSFERDISIFTIEHNFVQNDRDEIYSLMRSNGYSRVFERFSAFDDWYIKNSLLEVRTTEPNERC
jgi:FkbM family methyltransferase